MWEVFGSHDFHPTVLPREDDDKRDFHSTVLPCENDDERDFYPHSLALWRRR